MTSVMRVVLLACAAAVCLVSVPSAAVAALPANETGSYGADGTFRRTGTEVGKPAQAVRIVGSYRLKDDEPIRADRHCPSTGFAAIQALLPGITSGGSVVQYNWASKAVPSVQLVNKAWGCDGEVRGELELRARVDRPLFDICRTNTIWGSIPRLCNFRTTSGCEFKVLQYCPIRITGQARLYEGTSTSTNKLRRSRDIDVTLVGGNPLVPGSGGKWSDDNIELNAKAGDYFHLKLAAWVEPTFVLQK